MSQKLCHICGSDDFADTAHYNDHTMLENNQSCGKCRYNYDFSTGNYEETIGRWSAAWHHTETDEASLARRAARVVATLIRRLELGLIATSAKPFAEALAANPHDHTTALVLADWIDEHPEEFGPESGYQHTATLLRHYTDSSGFPPKCRECADLGEYFTHSSDCQERHCALAGGPNDCSGAIAPCDCQHARQTYEADP